MTNAEPLISIIIPTYNRANLLKETLESIILQTYKNWECIIVDDGSIDTTEEVVRKIQINDERFKYYKRPDYYKPGGNGARNYGYDLSQGHFTNWFDDDDLMLENFIDDKISLLDLSDCDIIIAAHKMIDSNQNVTKTLQLSITSDPLSDYVYWKENFAIVTNNVMFTKDFLIKNELRYNENILRAQEADLLSRAFMQSPKIEICNNITFLYRLHDKNKSTSHIGFNLKFRKDFVFINSNNFLYAIRNNKPDLAFYLNCRLIDDIFNYNCVSRNLSWYIYFKLVKVLILKTHKISWLPNVVLLPVYILTNIKSPIFHRLFYRNIFKN